jgi:hypothetical protein
MLGLPILPAFYCAFCCRYPSCLSLVNEGIIFALRRIFCGVFIRCFFTFGLERLFFECYYMMIILMDLQWAIILIISYLRLVYTEVCHNDEIIIKNSKKTPIT